MANVKPQVFWFIGGRMFPSGNRFIYGGGSGYHTRREAIRGHERDTGREWKELKRGGDFAVKCNVEPTHD